MFFYQDACVLLWSFLLSAGRWQLWSCGSAFLDQLEANEGSFLRMDWEGDWLQAPKIIFTVRETFWKEKKITLAANGMCKGLCTSIAELRLCADPATATCNLIFPGSLLPFSMWMDGRVISSWLSPTVSVTPSCQGTASHLSWSYSQLPWTVSWEVRCNFKVDSALMRTLKHTLT